MNKKLENREIGLRALLVVANSFISLIYMKEDNLICFQIEKVRLPTEKVMLLNEKIR